MQSKRYDDIKNRNMIIFWNESIKIDEKKRLYIKTKYISIKCKFEFLFYRANKSVNSKSISPYISKKNETLKLKLICYGQGINYNIYILEYSSFSKWT